LPRRYFNDSRYFDTVHPPEILLEFRAVSWSRYTVLETSAIFFKSFYLITLVGKQARVIACNNDGLWNETGAALEFTIQPAFYQTLWFQLSSLLIVSLIFFCLFGLFYRWRISLATERLNARLRRAFDRAHAHRAGTARHFAARFSGRHNASSGGLEFASGRA
jgi:hypothetical protein